MKETHSAPSEDLQQRLKMTCFGIACQRTQVCRDSPIEQAKKERSQQNCCSRGQLRSDMSDIGDDRSGSLAAASKVPAGHRKAT